MENTQIIFFDGTCMFCNKFISFMLKKEIPTLYFCDLNSNTAKQILVNNNLASNDINTIYFFSNKTIYSKSTAIIKILSLINNNYRIISFLLLIIPKILRDFLYTIISKNRHRLTKKHTCHLPSESQRKMILN